MPRPPTLLRVFLLLLMLCAASSSAAEERWLSVPSGAEIPVTVHSASAGPRVLWLPSEYGMRPYPQTVAAELASRGLETWVVDLHSGYFAPAGRNSLDDMPIEDLASIVTRAGKDGRPVILIATGRGAQLAIRATRALQEADAQTPPVQGLLLFHPYLYSTRPQAGSDADYLPVARAVNVPVYLVQPELSAKFWRMESTTAALEAGGAEVYRHTLPGLTDGFHLRDEADLSTAEIAYRSQQLPRLIERAVHLLNRRPAPVTAAPLPSSDAVNTRSTQALGLRPLDPAPAPPLAMQALDGNTYALEDYRGEVVLLSFWASWCPPCVEELPSLNRLKADFGDRGLRILSVDVGEPRSVVESFLEKIPVEFPVLHDLHGETVDDWKVYAYPTNYLIDRQGRLRFGHFGALDWNLPSSRIAIEDLLAEPAPSP